MGAWDIEEAYRDMLDECYGEIEICGYTYPASVALAQVDAIAYRQGLLDYEDSLDTEEEED